MTVEKISSPVSTKVLGRIGCGSWYLFLFSQTRSRLRYVTRLVLKTKIWRRKWSINDQISMFICAILSKHTVSCKQWIVWSNGSGIWPVSKLVSLEVIWSMLFPSFLGSEETFVTSCLLGRYSLSGFGSSIIRTNLFLGSICFSFSKCLPLRGDNQRQRCHS